MTREFTKKEDTGLTSRCFVCLEVALTFGTDIVADNDTSRDENTRAPAVIDPATASSEAVDLLKSTQEQHLGGESPYRTYTKDMKEYVPSQRRRTLSNREETREIRRLGACEACRRKKTKVGMFQLDDPRARLPCALDSVTECDGIRDLWRLSC